LQGVQDILETIIIYYYGVNIHQGEHYEEVMLYTGGLGVNVYEKAYKPGTRPGIHGTLCDMNSYCFSM
jgi:predicted adenine nucleotide alpha hydrolase (AANH) superfamily ATPase